MSIIYRTAGPWGAGQGSDLSAAQVDNNFWEIVSRLVNLEAVPAGVGIDYITVSGATFTVHLTDHSIEGPFPLPIAQWTFRGEWQASTPYVVNDVITFGGSLYIVIFNHTSGTVFDPNANDGLGHNYYLLVLEPFGVLPAGGDAGFLLAKHSGADYDVNWFDPAILSGIPAGGTTNQSLQKHSNADFDVFWGDNLSINGVPAGGTTGQFLKKQSSIDYAAGWADPPVGVPIGGLTGSVLTKHSASDYDVFWDTPPTEATKWYTASGSPTTLFNDGDLYLNSFTGDFFQQVAAVWTIQGNLKGPQGTPGTNGTNGLNGATWYNGSGTPSSGTGVNGDYYYRTSNGDVYQKQSGSWVLIGNLTPALPTGGTTGQVLTKNSSTNYDVSWQSGGGGGGGGHWPRRNGSISAPPAAASWSTLGTGTLADFAAGSDTGVRLTTAGSNGNNYLFGCYKAQSFGADFTCTVGLRRHMPIVNFNAYGVLLWNTSNSKGYFVGSGGANSFGRWKWDGGATSFNGSDDLVTNGGTDGYRMPWECWFRVALSGSTLTFYFSYDGNYFAPIATKTLTEFNASSFDSIGLGISRNWGMTWDFALDCADFLIV